MICRRAALLFAAASAALVACGTNAYVTTSSEPQPLVDAGAPDVPSGDAPSSDDAGIHVVPRGLSVVAGQLGGEGTADDVGTQARFEMLNGAWHDGSGSLYVTDNDGSSIRKIDLATRETTTLAGGRPDMFGAIGTGCADGVGPAAQFKWPTGITGDGAGNLYISDAGCSAIRRLVIATGQVTTVATLPGTIPYGVTWAGDGALFIGADTSIRRLAIATGELTTLTWTVGQLSYAGPLAYDGSSTLYVCEWSQNDIRKLDLSAQTITLLAGQPGQTGLVDGVGPTALFSEPWGIALDGKGSLFVAENLNNTIRRIDLATATVTLFAGHAYAGGDGASFVDGVGTKAGFWYPNGLAFDGQHTLFVAEDTQVRTLDTTTAATATVAGLRYHIGFQDGTAAAATFQVPSGAVVDEHGDLLVMDMGTGLRAVRMVDGTVTTLNAPGLGTSTVGYLDPSGDLYLGQINRVMKFDRKMSIVAVVAGQNITGTTCSEADGVGTAATFSWINGITGDGAGHLFVTDDEMVREIDLATSRVTTLAGNSCLIGHVDGTGANVRFSNSWGIAVRGDDVYVADRRTLRHLSLATGAVTTVAGDARQVGGADGVGTAARFDEIAGLSFDHDGTLLIADQANGSIRRFDPVTSSVTTVAGKMGVHGVAAGALPGRLNEPSLALPLPDGDLAIVETLENVILRARR